MLRRTVLLFGIIMGLVGCQNSPIAPTASSIFEATAVSTTTTAVPPTETPEPAPTATRQPFPLGGVIWNQVESGVVHFDQPLVLEFNQPMDTNSSSIPLRFKPYVPGAFSWDEGGTMLTFTPIERFTPGQAYQITQAANLKAQAELPEAEALVWQIRMLPAPRIVSSELLKSSQVVEDEWYIDWVLRFDQEMDWYSVVDALSVEPDIPLVASWLENGRLQQYQLRNAQGQIAGLDREAAPQANEVWFQAKVPFNVAQSYQFTVDKTAVDMNQAPIIVAYQQEISPPLLAATLEEKEPPQLRFNYRLNLEHLLQAITVNPAIEGEWQATWEGSETILSLDSEDLPAGAAYQIDFQSPLLYPGGVLLNKPAPIAFSTTPLVTEIYPETEEWEMVAAETNLEMTFTRQVDRESVIEGIQIEPPISGDYSWMGNTLIFEPEKGFFAGNTRYTVSLETTIQDVEGKTVLTEPYRWIFNTGELHTDADFGYGQKTQVVDANGRRAVQYRSYSAEPITVTFGLYDLNAAEALQTWGGEWVDIQTLPQVITWTAVTEPQAFDDGDYVYVNPQESFIPADVPPGPYLMTTDAGVYHDELLIFLSQYTTAVKRAGSQITVWTTDINGDVAGNLQVRIVDGEGRELANGRSDAIGLYQTNLPPDVHPAFVVVSAGEDMVVSRVGGRAYAPPATLIHIHTDRPIYRPGHTVYFKAQLRTNDDVAMEPLPEGSAITARIWDARNNAVQTFALTTNHFGSVFGEFMLADGAALGEYRVEIVAPDGRSVSQIFKVEDYRKPEYEVTVTTDADRYLEGDTISVTVDSAYFFGEPVTKAYVEVHQFLDDGYGGWWASYMEPIQGETDENGRFTFTLKAAGEIRQALEVIVDDGSHQSVFGHTEFTVHAIAEIIGLDGGSYRKEPNQPVAVQVRVQDIFGEPVANRTVTLSLSHYDPDKGDWVQIDDFSGETGTNGRFPINFTPTELGYYKLQAQAEDRLGNALSATYNFIVYHRTAANSRWFRSTNDLTMSSSEGSYAPGDTAQFFIESTFSGPALLTLERADVRSQQLVHLTAPLTVIDVPITSEDTPNIYASVMAWKAQDTAVLGENSVPDSRLLISTVEIPVSTAEKTLNVEIVPDKERYAPGEETAVTLRVTNHRGDPVSAELSLAVVDEAIYSLSPDLSPSLLGAFYFRRPNEVSNANAMQGTRRLWYYTYDDYGGMGGGGDDEAVNLQPRQDFKDTAAWFPVLHTDANGEVTVTFTLPDNITSWRMTARAATTDTQVGEAIHNVTTWQPVLVRPALPRILTAGDELLLSAVVHNNTDTAQPANVTLQVSGSELTIADEAPQTVTVPPNSVSVVGWPVTAVAAGTITLTVQAEADGKMLDAVALPLTIQPLAVPDVTSDVGQFEGSYTTEILWPEDALPLSSVQIDLSRSIAGSMTQGLEYLTGYPYGCVEQTMSRALPNAVVARAFSQLGNGDPGKVAQLEPLIRASVQRLYGFQHGDGGWGWWTHDASHDYQTAWVIFGLTKTAESGYEIEPAVIERGANWLLAHLDEMDGRTRAFALYSLAISGRGNLPYTLATAANRSQLDTFSRAALILALDELGETAVATELMDELIESATVEDGLVFWPSETGDGYYRNKTMASTTRNTALALSALVQMGAEEELQTGVVRYLMSQRKMEGWGSTNETAFTILALTDYLLALQDKADVTETEYTVTLNGTVVTTGTLQAETLAAQIIIPAEAMVAGENNLHIAYDGTLYHQISSRVYLAQPEIEASGKVFVTRMYRDALTDEVITAVTPNQLVKVEVAVTLPQSASYVIVEDSLPGGLEALNEHLDTNSIVAEERRPDWDWEWQGLGYDHKEIRGNRVSFFITNMAEGRHTFTYFARATHVGDFVAMPAEVYAMYDTAVWGRSATRPFAITSE